MSDSDSSATPVLLLASWSVTTTLQDWAKLPASIRRRTARAASLLPHRDTPRSRWEANRTAAVTASLRK